MSNFKPRKPDLILKVRLRDGSEGTSAVVGVAWLNPEGHVSITLNPGVTLSWNDGLQITAFPATQGKGST
jgi:hypothetical protein